MIRTHLDMLPDLDHEQQQQHLLQLNNHYQLIDQPQILPDDSSCLNQQMQQQQPPQQTTHVTLDNINQSSNLNLVQHQQLQQWVQCDLNTQETTKFPRELVDPYVQESRWHPKLSWSYQPSYRRAASLYSTTSDSDSIQSDQVLTDKEEEEFSPKSSLSKHDNNTTVDGHSVSKHKNNHNYKKNISDDQKQTKSNIIITNPKGSNKQQQEVTSDSCISLDCDHVIDGMPRQQLNYITPINVTTEQNVAICVNTTTTTSQHANPRLSHHQPQHGSSTDIRRAYSSSGRGNSESVEFVKWPYQSTSVACSQLKTFMGYKVSQDNPDCLKDCHRSLCKQLNEEKENLLPCRDVSIDKLPPVVNSATNVSTWQKLTDKIYPLITTGNGSGIILCGPGMVPESIESDQHEKIPFMRSGDEINMCNPVIITSINKKNDTIENQLRLTKDNIDLASGGGVKVSAKNVTSYGSAIIKTISLGNQKADCSILIDQDTRRFHLPPSLNYIDYEERKRFKKSLAILFVLAVVLITVLVALMTR